MLVGTGTKKAVRLESAWRGCYKRSSSNSITKELFPRKMLDGTGIEKARLTQYVKRGWHHKAEFTENARRGWSKQKLLQPNILGGAGMKKLFLLRSFNSKVV